jgi:hypothetical protein
MTDDGGIGEHVQRLGDERAERGDGEAQDLAVAFGPLKDRRARHRPKGRGDAGGADRRGGAAGVDQ